MESLEARALLTTFTVGSVNDSGPGSLRQAITDANNTPGADVIDFAIPGAGVHTIKPASPLPDITDAVTIDGYSQPGSHPNTKADGDDAVIAIEIDGSAPESYFNLGPGLYISRGDGTTIQGLAIGGFSDGIVVGFVKDAVIRGNFLGTDASGTFARPNGSGLGVQSSTHATIGGTDPASRNVISGNQAFGLTISRTDINSQTLVQGNFIGTDASGTRALGNGWDGIAIGGASGVTIGGPDPGARNVISGNGTAAANVIGSFSLATNFVGNGIHIQTLVDSKFGMPPVVSRGDLIQNNAIGTDLSGQLDLGNAFNGILREAGDTNPIVGNVIKHNGALSIYTPPTAAEFAANDLIGNKDHVTDLLVGALAGPPAVTVGAPVLMTIAVANASSSPADGVLLNVAMPAGTTAVAVSGAQLAPGTDGKLPSEGFVAQLGTIPAGGFRTVTVLGAARFPSDPIYRYPAVIRATTSTFEPNPDNNMANPAIFVASAPHILGLVPLSDGARFQGLFLSTDVPLNPRRATDLRNFRVTTPGRDGRFGTRDDRNVPLRAAGYDPASQTIALQFRGAGPPLGTLLRVRVSPGVTDVRGVPLDGNNDNVPGGTFDKVTTIGPRITYFDRNNDRVTLNLTGGGRLGTVSRPNDDLAILVVAGVGPSTPGVLTGTVVKGRGGDGVTSVYDGYFGLDSPYLQDRLTNPPFLGLPIFVQATRKRPG